MRLLMLFTLGFCSGCAVCAYLAWNMSELWLSMAALAFLLFLLCLAIRKRPARVIAVCMLGVSVAFVWFFGYDRAYLRFARANDQVTCQAEILVQDYSFPQSYGVAADGSVVIGGADYRVRLYLDEYTQLNPGDRVLGQFRFRYTGMGAQKDATFHKADGIFLLAYSRDEAVVIEGDEDQPQFFPAKLRQGVLGVIDEIFPADTAAFASALLLGEDDGLTYEENTALKISGIRHVVAVSGQHLVILLAAIMLLSGRSRRLACYISIPVTILFSAMVGFTPSIMRACVMQLVMLAAFLSKRDYDGPTALSFAVLLMVAANPLAITSVSLQLSAGSIIGMFAFSSRIYKRMRSWFFFANIQDDSLAGKLLHWFIGSLSVTLGSMAVTVPLSAVYFRTVSLVGIVTNLLTLWLITLVFYGMIAAVAVGAVWSVAGAFLAKLLCVPVRFILAAAKALSAIPGGCLYLRSDYIIYACIAAYLVLLFMLFWKNLRVWMGACIITCILFLGLCASWLQPLQDNWRITMLDVGQGQCIILQSGDRVYMVDCGGEYADSAADIAAETLLSMGISRLDGLILTHFDSDHTCGVENLLTRIEIDSLLLPDEPENTDYGALTKKFPNSTLTVTQDLSFTWDSAKITVFAANGGENGNEKSLCVLFQSGNCDILITGDRPVHTELALVYVQDIPELDYLVAGHHGAQSSTSNALLSRLKPKTVLISVGKDNRYGHPAPALLERLKEHGCKILRTDLLGTIIIRG